MSSFKKIVRVNNSANVQTYQVEGKKKDGLYFASNPPKLMKSNTNSAKPHRQPIRVTSAIYLTVALTFLCAIIAFVSDTLDPSLTTVAAQAEKSPIIALILTSITKSIWKTVEHDIIFLAPFWRRDENSLPTKRFLRANRGFLARGRALARLAR